MALQLASVALVASTSLLVNAIPVEQAAARRPEWESEWDNDWENDDDDDDDDDNEYGYGRRSRQYRGYRNGLSQWYHRQSPYYGRGYRSWNKRSVATGQHKVRSVQQGPWNPLGSLIGTLFGGPRGNRNRDDEDDDRRPAGQQIIYVPVPNGYPAGYSYPNGYPGANYPGANYPGANYPGAYPVGLPAGFPAGYPVAFYPPGQQGAGVGISQPLYPGTGAQGGVRPQPKGWPPVVGGPGAIPFITGPVTNGNGQVGQVGFGIGSAGFTVDGPQPTPAPGYPVGYPVGGGVRPGTGVTATLPGGVGNVGLGPISGGFSVDGGMVTPATTPIPAPVDGGVVTPAPAPPVGPPAAGITGTLSNGNVPVGNVGLGIGSASFSVDGGNTAASPTPAPIAVPVPAIPSPSPVAPSPVSPPAAGITGTLTNGATPVGNVGLGIGGSSFSVDGSNNAIPAAGSPAAVPVDGGVVTPAPTPTPAPARPTPAGGITADLTSGSNPNPVGNVGLGIGGSSFSVDGSNNAIPAAGSPAAVPVDGGVVTPAPAPAPTPAPARPSAAGGITAGLTNGANTVGVAGLGIGGSSFSVGS